MGLGTKIEIIMISLINKGILSTIKDFMTMGRDSMDPNQIGKRIKELRQRRGITQVELAASLSVASSTISHWEKGRRLPSIIELERIATHFNVSLTVFDSSLRPTYDKQVEHARSSEETKSIQIRPLGLRYTGIMSSFLVISVLLLTTSLLWDDAICEITFILGVSFSLAAIILYYIVSVTMRHTSSKQYTVPISYKFFYETDMTEDAIHTKKRILLTGSYVLVFTTTLMHILVNLAFLNTHLVYWHLSVSIYGLFILIFVWTRFQCMNKTPLFKKKVDFDQCPSSLRCRLFYVVWSFDMISLIGLTYLILSVRAYVLSVPLAYTAFGLGSFNAFSSFCLTVFYKHYTSRFELKTTPS